MQEVGQTAADTEFQANPAKDCEKFAGLPPADAAEAKLPETAKPALKRDTALNKAQRSTASTVASYPPASASGKATLSTKSAVKRALASPTFSESQAAARVRTARSHSSTRKNCTSSLTAKAVVTSTIPLFNTRATVAVSVAKAEHLDECGVELSKPGAGRSKIPIRTALLRQLQKVLSRQRPKSVTLVIALLMALGIRFGLTTVKAELSECPAFEAVKFTDTEQPILLLHQQRPLPRQRPYYFRPVPELR